MVFFFFLLERVLSETGFADSVSLHLYSNKNNELGVIVPSKCFDFPAPGLPAV